VDTTTTIHTHLQDDLQDDFQDPHTKKGKKSGGGIARLSSDTPMGGDTMERPDCRRGDHHETQKKAAAQHPNTTIRIYMGPGTYKPIPETPKQKKYIRKETEKENRGNTTHHPHTKKKER